MFTELPRAIGAVVQPMLA